MKKKGNFRKVVSGLLAGMTMLSTMLSPMTAYAAEIQPEEKPPLYAMSLTLSKSRNRKHL